MRELELKEADLAHIDERLEKMYQKQKFIICLQGELQLNTELRLYSGCLPWIGGANHSETVIFNDTS